MPNLYDFPDRISLAELDHSNMLAHLEAFPKWLSEAKTSSEMELWLTACGKEFPRNIIFCGMGGSAIGAQFAIDLFQQKLPSALVLCRGKSLPAFCNEEDLVICTSYSGGTDETLSCYQDALNKGCRIAGLGSGGDLESLMQEKKWPYLKLPAGFPPRAAFPFMAVPLASLLESLVRNELKMDWDQAIANCSVLSQSFSPENRDNQAMKLAKELQDRIPFFYTWRGAESGVVRFRAQVEENAKQLASYHLFPEMAHNEIAGWENPKALSSMVTAVFLESSFFPEGICKCMTIAREILTEKGIRCAKIDPLGEDWLSQLLGWTLLADWTSYYLAILNQVDPTPIAAIQRLKEEMGKRL